MRNEAGGVDEKGSIYLRLQKYLCGLAASGQFPVLSVPRRKAQAHVFHVYSGDPCIYSGGKGDIRTSVCMHVAELVVRAKKKAREASVRQFESQDLEFSTGTGLSSLV